MSSARLVSLVVAYCGGHVSVALQLTILRSPVYCTVAFVGTYRRGVCNSAVLQLTTLSLGIALGLFDTHKSQSTIIAFIVRARVAVR